MMNFFSILMGATEGGDGGGGGAGSIVLIVVLVLVMVVLLVGSMIPQRRNKKKAQEQLNAIIVGDKVKTIGGLIGIVEEIDAVAGTMVINIAPTSDDNKVLITIDRAGIYTVIDIEQEKAMLAQQRQIAEEQAVIEAAAVKSADDLVGDEALKVKEAKKQAKKQAKLAAKAERAQAYAQEVQAKANLAAEDLKATTEELNAESADAVEENVFEELGTAESKEPTVPKLADLPEHKEKTSDKKND